MFLVFAATFAAWALVGSGLLALYDAVVGSSPDVFLLWFVLLFWLPLAATFLARGAIWRWICRHSRSE
jgi:hypothetical protein